MARPFCVGVEPRAGVSPASERSPWRRTQASTAHSAGDWTGTSGSSETPGPSPTHPSTLDNTRASALGGPDAAPTAAGTAGAPPAAGDAAEELPGADPTVVLTAAGGGAVGGCAGGGGVASACTTTVDRRVAAGAPADPDGFCGPLPVELCPGCAAPRGALGVGVAAAATGVPGATPCPA